MPGFLQRLLVCASLTLAAGAQAADELVFCFENENVRPWRTKAGTGLNFELLDRVAADLNLKFRYEGAPWKRCLYDVKTNRHAGALGASFKPERLDIGSYPGGRQPDPARLLYAERYVAVRRKGSNVEWNGEQFRNLNGIVGAPLGYSVADDLRKEGIPVDDGAHTAQDVLQKLILGRIELAILLQGELLMLLAEDARLKEKLEVLPKPFAEKPYYLILSHRLVDSRPELAELIWSAIARERARPAYQEKERRALGLSR